MLYKTVDGEVKAVVPLSITPFADQDASTLTGSINGTFYGHYSLDYKLPNGDYLRLFTSHNKTAPQIVLITNDAQRIKRMPGKRQASLVANMISEINRYVIHSEHYPKPRNAFQIKKHDIAKDCIADLQNLLTKERSLSNIDWTKQEELRREIIEIIDKANQDNRTLANHPLVSEGKLGEILYDANQKAQLYEFNRAHPVSKLDQLNFEDTEFSDERMPYYVWDSDLYLENEEDTLDCLRVICKEYNLNEDNTLTLPPADRFGRFIYFFKNLWQDFQKWVDYVLIPNKPNRKIDIENNTNNDIHETKITPYFDFEGISQKGYDTIEALISEFIDISTLSQLELDITNLSNEDIEKKIEGKFKSEKNSYIHLKKQKMIYLNFNNETICLHYFKEDSLYFPLPTGKDLLVLCQLSKEHLFLPERIMLGLKSFFSQIPTFFITLFKGVAYFLTHDLYDDFYNHINQGHIKNEKELSAKVDNRRLSLITYLNDIQDILRQKQLLKNGQTLEQFVEEQLRDSPYIFVRETHVPSPPAYNNPAHRLFSVIRHFAHFFIDTSEKNPITGTLAMAAYAYGAGAILAPELLTKILIKLHLNGLIKGIAPTQAFGHWMSNSPLSEAVSAAVAYWQGIIVAGSLDQFFIDAIEVLKDEPAEIAIIVSLAIGLGYGLCKAIPALKDEVGTFPYINYGVLGAKGGAAIYDVIMHTGDDWLLGTIKWVLKSILTLVKILVSPLFEAYYYGFEKGFLAGLKKSASLILKSGKQIIATGLDFILNLLSIPFIEIAALLIHVPLLGLSTLISKTLSAIGNWTPIGKTLVNHAIRPFDYNYFENFKLSPLYGFTNPIKKYAENKVLNVLANILMVLVLPILELIKNIIVLPLFEIGSLTVRLLLSIIDPSSRFIALITGYPLYFLGYYWDNSAGVLFRWLAENLSIITNIVESFFSTMKQFIVSHITIARRYIFDWAYGDEDLAYHQVNTPDNLDPMSIEKVPHTREQCLHNLLSPTKEHPHSHPHQNLHTPTPHKKPTPIDLGNIEPILIKFDNFDEPQTPRV